MASSLILITHWIDITRIIKHKKFENLFSKNFLQATPECLSAEKDAVWIWTVYNPTALNEWLCYKHNPFMNRVLM